MFKKLTNKILGFGPSKRGPLQDIPVFEDIDVIGAPKNVYDVDQRQPFGGQDVDLLDDEMFDSSNKGPTGRRKSFSKAAVEKENIPKIPRSNNTLPSLEQQEAIFKLKSALNEKQNAKNVNNANTVKENTTKNTGNIAKEHHENEDGKDKRFESARSLSRKVSFSELPKEEEEIDPFAESVFLNKMNTTVEAPRNRSLTDEEKEKRDYLFSKVRHNHVEVVNSYLEKNYTAYKEGWSICDNGNTLIHVAVQNNLKKMCSTLLKHDFPLNKENKKGMTPLDYAELYHFTALSDWLHRKGAINGSNVGRL